MFWVSGSRSSTQTSGAVISDQHRSYRLPTQLTSRPSRLATDSSSDPTYDPYAAHFEGDINKGVSNSWVQSILNREKLAPMPQLEVCERTVSSSSTGFDETRPARTHQIEVTKEYECAQIELQHRDSFAA